MKVLEIETPSGMYKVRKPVGRVGVRWLALMIELADYPLSMEEMQALPLEQKRVVSQALADVLERFVVEVLPQIFVDGPFKPEEIPPEDVMVIFVQMAEEAARIQQVKFPSTDARDAGFDGTDDTSTS